MSSASTGDFESCAYHKTLSLATGKVDVTTSLLSNTVLLKPFKSALVWPGSYFHNLMYGNFRGTTIWGALPICKIKSFVPNID